MSIEFMQAQLRTRTAEVVQLEHPLAVADLPTPALVLNRAAFERNLARMASHVAQFDKGFRPHAKTHKCPVICAAQIDAGAVGVCVAKLSEAVVMVQAGVHDVLITSPLTTMMVDNSVLLGNSSTANGGGIYNSGTVTVSDSVLSGNCASCPAKVS